MAAPTTIQHWYDGNHLSPRKPLSNLIPRKQQRKASYRVYRSAPLYRTRKGKANPMPHLYAVLGAAGMLGLLWAADWVLRVQYGLGL